MSKAFSSQNVVLKFPEVLPMSLDKVLPMSVLTEGVGPYGCVCETYAAHPGLSVMPDALIRPLPQHQRRAAGGVGPYRRTERAFRIALPVIASP